MLFEEIKLTTDQIENFRDVCPDIGEDAVAVLCRTGGWFVLKWTIGTTIFEFNPEDRTRRYCGLGPDDIWTDWQ